MYENEDGDLVPLLPSYGGDRTVQLNATFTPSSSSSSSPETHSIRITVKSIIADNPKGLQKLLDILSAEAIILRDLPEDE